MKKIIFILSLFICSYSFGQAFIDSAGGLEPSGAFAGYYSKYIQGSSKVVYDTTARNSIPSYFRDTTTFLCYTIKDSSLWRLSGGISNSNFVRISQLSQSGYGVNAIKNGGNSFGGSASIGTNDSNFVYLKTNGINRWSISPFDGRLTYGATSLRGDDYGSITTGQGYFARVSATDYISFPSDTIAHSGYSDVISFQNGVPYYNSGGVWHAFLNDSVLYYSAGYGLNLSPTGQFKVDSTVIMPKKDSGYLYVTPTQLALKVNKSDSGIVFATPTKVKNDSITLANQTVTGLSSKLNKSNFIDSLNGRNATLLGNTTTGSGSTIVLNGSPTLTLPNISAVNVSGGILSFPTGGSGTLALRGDTGTYFYPYSSNPKSYIGLTSLSATRNVSSGSIFTYNSATGAYNFDTTVYLRKQDSTLYTTPTALNNRISSITLNTPSVTYTNPINFTNTGGSWSGTLTLANQSPYTIFRRGSGTGTPSWSYIDTNYFNNQWANYVRAAQNNSSGGGLVGNGTVSSKVVPLANWSMTNASLSNTKTYVTEDTTNGKITFNSSVSASSNYGSGTLITDTITATANNDTLIALDLKDSLNSGSYTGTLKASLRTKNAVLVGGDTSLSIGDTYVNYKGKLGVFGGARFESPYGENAMINTGGTGNALGTNGYASNVLSLRHTNINGSSSVRFLRYNDGAEVGACGYQNIGTNSWYGNNSVFLAASMPYYNGGSYRAPVNLVLAQEGNYNGSYYTNPRYKCDTFWNQCFYDPYGNIQLQIYPSGQTIAQFQGNSNGNQNLYVNNSNTGTSSSANVRVSVGGTFIGSLSGISPNYTYGGYPANGLALIGANSTGISLMATNSSGTIQMFTGGEQTSNQRWQISSSGNVSQTGNLTLSTAGNKINIATGTNASIGTATLASGTVTVSTTAVTSSSLIFITHAGTSTSNLGTLYIGTITAGTSFVINSTNASDGDKINWWIIN